MAFIGNSIADHVAIVLQTIKLGVVMHLVGFEPAIPQLLSNASAE